MIKLKSKKSPYNINKCAIIKELGQGMVGTTYLVEYNSNQYALKIEKIPESHILEKSNTKYSEWREIEFSERFGNKYPEQFIKLFAWDVIDNCDYSNSNQNNNLIFLPIDIQKTIQEKIASKYCIRKLYSLVDTDLSKIIRTLNKKQIYSLVIQTLHIIWLLDTKGYSHNDLHSQNIGVIYTRKKNINIFHNNRQKQIPIPTYGYIYVALDFGCLTKNTWELGECEKKSNHGDIMRILKRIINYEDKFYIGNKLTNKIISIKQIKADLLDLIKSTIEWQNLKEYLDTDKQQSNPDDKIILFQILYPEIFQQIFFEDKFEKVIKLTFQIEIEDIIYFLKNKSNLKKLIKYFVRKIYNIA